MSRTSDLTSDASRRDPPPVPSRDAMVAKFTKVLPGWLRRCGVQQAEIADAVQEALMAALVKLRECPDGVALDDAKARHELMRIVSNVALRARRQAQRDNDRYLSIENIEMPSARDEEAWVEARVVVLAALANLDEPTRALIFAHEIEGQTNVEIAAALKLKEDAVEKRVFFAKQRLRTEVEQIEQGWARRRHVDGSVLLAMGFDSFDRAVFGAVHEILGRKLVLAPPAKMWNFVRSNFPTAVVAGSLAMAPNPFPSMPSIAEDLAVRHEKHVLSVDVPLEEASDSGLAERTSVMFTVPLIFWTQEFTLTPSSSVVETPAAVQTFATRVARPIGVPDVSEEEKAHRARDMKWGGSNTPRFDD